MNRMSAAIVVAVIAIVAAASASAYFLTRDSGGNDDSPTVDPEAKKMNLIMTVDGVKVSVDWEDNPSIDAIKTLAKDTLTIDMERYGGFEQTGQIGRTVTRDDTDMDVGCGDIVLYNGKQICLYFNDNSYSFTRLGKVTGMSDAEIIGMLDRPSVTAVFTLE